MGVQQALSALWLICAIYFVGLPFRIFVAVWARWNMTSPAAFSFVGSLLL
jgi:hypothetical protein